MRFRSAAFLPLLIFTTCIPLSAQQPPQRDPQAVAAINNALAALGGQGAIPQIRDCVARGSTRVPEGSPLANGNFIWKNAGEEFRYEYATSSAVEVFSSGHGRPAIRKADDVARLHGHMALANFPPHLPGVVLLKQLTDPKYTLTFLGPGVLADRQVIRVRTSLDSDIASAAVTPQVWSFDATNGLPLRVEYRWPDNSNAESFVPVVAEFSDLRSVAGVVVPFRIVHHVNNELIATSSLDSVTFNTGLDSAEFDLDL